MNAGGVVAPRIKDVDSTGLGSLAAGELHR